MVFEKAIFANMVNLPHFKGKTHFQRKKGPARGKNLTENLPKEFQIPPLQKPPPSKTKGSTTRENKKEEKEKKTHNWVFTTIHPYEKKVVNADGLKMT